VCVHQEWHTLEMDIHQRIVALILPIFTFVHSYSYHHFS
jgi:hypothetical protein